MTQTRVDKARDTRGHVVVLPLPARHSSCSPSCQTHTANKEQTRMRRGSHETGAYAGMRKHSVPIFVLEPLQSRPKRASPRIAENNKNRHTTNTIRLQQCLLSHNTLGLASLTALKICLTFSVAALSSSPYRNRSTSLDLKCRYCVNTYHKEKKKGSELGSVSAASR